jgi:hypothetical protein
MKCKTCRCLELDGMYIGLKTAGAPAGNPHVAQPNGAKRQPNDEQVHLQDWYVSK